MEESITPPSPTPPSSPPPAGATDKIPEVPGNVHMFPLSLSVWFIVGFVPYVLVGAGTASFAAAKAIREKDQTAKILIIGKY